MTTPRHKTARTIRDFPTTFSGYTFTVPAGSLVSNRTACGYDDNYRFLAGVVALAKQVTGFPDSILYHDLKHYGLNIPAEYCEPYPV